MNVTYHPNVVQGSDAWLQMRCGLLTAAFVWAQWSASQARRILKNLRQNCFVTNEQGHRVRYVKASEAARAKAETE